MLVQVRTQVFSLAGNPFTHRATSLTHAEFSDGGSVPA